MRAWIILILAASAVTCYGQSTTAGGGYSGPSILSRAGSPIGRAGSQPLAFRFFASGVADYVTGITQPVTDQSGNLTKLNAYGGTGAIGVNGVRYGKRDRIAFDWRGLYRAYNGSRQQVNGFETFLSTDYGYQISRRTTFEFSSALSSYQRAFGSVYTPVGVDLTNAVANPADEGFDGRTNSIVATAGIGYMLTSRWQMAVFGGGDYVKRHSQALVSSTGYQGGASASYLLGPHSSIGVNYSYNEYEFSGRYGRSRYHNPSFFYNQALSPVWKLSLSAGAYRVELSRLMSVRLDPVIAAIIGQTTTLQPLEQISYGPSAGVTIAREFERSVFSLYFWRGIRPGNGFITTSESDTTGAQYSYTATERLNVGLNLYVNRQKAIMQGDQIYYAAGGNVGLNYQLRGAFYLTTFVSYWHNSLNAGGLDRNRLDVGAGITWSPGELPLSLF